MSFWEFDCACDGFESFHAAPSDEPGSRAPSAQAFYAALGIRPESLK